ncbi:MAG: PTS sugar transporter subunit IIA [Treponema sp.]|jgi:PTS system fructose-specific IIC component/PTS system nitrogen regulatory IIA component|nr:PTS sugar transporter subunit IIA [Treponema sp.]
MPLSSVFDKRSIKLNLESTTKETAFKELIETIAVVHDELDGDIMLASVQEREDKLNTSVASGIAVPHGYYPGTDCIFGALGISKKGIEYGAFDGKPVHCVFLIVLGEASREKHLRVLNRVMSLINSEDANFLRTAKSAEEIHHVLSRL